jgi:hypothetical protein
MRPQGQGDSLRILGISKCTWGLALTMAALTFHSYYVREVLVSMALFGLGFLFLAVLVFAAVLCWWVGEQLANRAGPASRKLLALHLAQFRSCLLGA